jgi:hypothetical protein
LIEYGSTFHFTQDFCAKSFKTARNIIHGYSPLNIFCPDVVRVISSFLWGKDNQYYLFVSKTVWLMDIGHHFESFTVGNRDLVDRYGIYVS